MLSLDVDGPTGVQKELRTWQAWTMMNYDELWWTIVHAFKPFEWIAARIQMLLNFVALNSGARGVSQQSWLLFPKDKGGNSRCRDELSHGFQYITELQFLKHQPTILYTVYLYALRISYSLKVFLHVFKMLTGWELDTLSNGRWTQLTKRANRGRWQVHMKKAAATWRVLMSTELNQSFEFEDTDPADSCLIS